MKELVLSKAQKMQPGRAHEPKDLTMRFLVFRLHSGARGGA